MFGVVILRRFDNSPHPAFKLTAVVKTRQPIMGP